MPLAALAHTVPRSSRLDDEETGGPPTGVIFAIMRRTSSAPWTASGCQKDNRGDTPTAGHLEPQQATPETSPRSWLVVERLPAYAPELNPVEGLWSSLKAVELANPVSPTLAAVIDQAHRGIDRVRRTPHLLVPAACRLVGLMTSTRHPGPVRDARPNPPFRRARGILSIMRICLGLRG